MTTGPRSASLAGQRIVLIGALPESLLRFRGDLIGDLIAAGAEVIAMSAPAPAEVVQGLQALGCRFVPFPVARTGHNPLEDLATLVSLVRTLRRLRPDQIVAYTIKPVIYGGLARRFCGARFHALITGLGIAFNGNTLRGRLLTGLVERLYRAALGRAGTVFFQNEDDRRVFIERRLIEAERTVLLAGTGINLATFRYHALPEGPPVFLMLARLLKSKGVLEYAEAARRLRARHPGWRFVLAGAQDSSPDAVSEADVARLKAEGHVHYLGYQSDVLDLLVRCHVFVLPTYYPEGRPRTVQEALAVGRPVVTTDMPGCRDAVQTGVNGWIIPARDAGALEAALLAIGERWADLPALSRAARRLAEERYDVRAINRRMIEALAARS